MCFPRAPYQYSRNEIELIYEDVNWKTTEHRLMILPPKILTLWFVKLKRPITRIVVSNFDHDFIFVTFLLQSW